MCESLTQNQNKIKTHHFNNAQLALFIINVLLAFFGVEGRVVSTILAFFGNSYYYIYSFIYFTLFLFFIILRIIYYIYRLLFFSLFLFFFHLYIPKIKYISLLYQLIKKTIKNK